MSGATKYGTTLTWRLFLTEYGITHAADVLRHIDAYYSDQRGPGAEGVATQLARQLADPKPADARTIGQLGRYKGLDTRWTDWET